MRGSQDGAPSTSITVLENAQSQPIDADEYQTRLDMGALGQNHLRTDFAQDSAPVIAASGSSLNSPAARTVVGGFLGLLVGIGLALFAERLDRRLRTRDEIEEAFGLPVLAEVPKLSRADLADDALVSFTTPMSRVAEAFRAVRPDDPVIVQLRTLARTEDDLKRDLGRLSNRLREQVYRVAPGLARVSPAADEPWFWSLVVSVLLFSLPTTIASVGSTLFGSGTTTDLTFAYSQGPSAPPLAPLVPILKIIGFIAVIRGLFVLRAVGVHGSNPQARITGPRGATLVGAGVLLVHMKNVLTLFANTTGLNLGVGLF